MKVKSTMMKCTVVELKDEVTNQVCSQCYAAAERNQALEKWCDLVKGNTPWPLYFIPLTSG